MWPVASQQGWTRSCKPVPSANDRLIDPSQTAWERSQNIIRSGEVHDPREMVDQEGTARGRRPKLHALAFRGGMPLHDDMSLLVLRMVLVHAQGWTRDLA